MKRRTLLQQAGLLGAGLLSGISRSFGAPDNATAKRPVLRIAHVTDIHIRPDLDAPARFRKCMAELRRHQPAFFLNGGDSVFAADQSKSSEQLLAQWTLWKSLESEFDGREVFSCLGNHDMWWDTNTSDPLYGKPFAVQQLKIPNRYYSFDRKGWHFVVLDSNNPPAGSLDAEQRSWLENDLKALTPGTPVLVLSHYPTLGVCTIIEGGNHTDAEYLNNLFVQHKDKKFHCLSGHIHQLDYGRYNHVHYYGNGAVSGHWWDAGNEASAAKYYVKQTPPGYAIVDLYADGTMQNEFYEYTV